MYSLILDSATPILYIALIKDKDIVFEKYLEGRNEHSKNIVDYVNKALVSANITSKDLSNVVIGIGPGSYTGVRMALTVGKIMAAFSNIKLYKISTLKLMASGYLGIVKAQIDARSGNCFGAVINTKTNEYVINEAHMPIDSFNAEYEYEVNELNYKVNPLWVLNNMEYVEVPDLLVPNYLRDTEAERKVND